MPPKQVKSKGILKKSKPSFEDDDLAPKKSLFAQMQKPKRALDEDASDNNSSSDDENVSPKKKQKVNKNAKMMIEEDNEDGEPQEHNNSDEEANSDDDDEEAEEEENETKEEQKVMASILNRRYNRGQIEGEEEDSSDDDAEEGEEDNEKLLSYLNKEVFKKGKKAAKSEDDEDDTPALLNEQRQSTASTEFNKLDKGKKIELQDLISTIDDDDEEEESNQPKNVADSAKVKENIVSLDRISREKQRGMMFQAMDDHAVELAEKRAAFDQVEEQMQKWVPVVDYLDRARTVPLITDSVRGRPKPRIAKAKVHPTEEFDEILEQKIAEREQQAEIVVDPAEQLELDANRKLTKEELLAKHREIAKRRVQMYYQHKKLAQLKKIKSKAYRRRLKKSKEREMEKEDLSKLDEEELRERAEKAEKEYIKERLTLKHKNQSKWVKRAIQHSQHDEGLRQSVTDQLKLHEDIKRRQQKVREYMEDYEQEKMVDELFGDNPDKVIDNLREKVTNAEEEPQKGIFAMKFMQKAKEKKIKEQMELIDSIRADIKQQQAGGDDSDAEVEQENPSRRHFSSSEKNVSSVNSHAASTSIADFAQTMSAPQQGKVYATGKLTVGEVPSVEIQKEDVIAVKVTGKSTKKETAAPAVQQPVIEQKKEVATTGATKRKRVERTTKSNPWLSRDEDKEERLSKRQKKNKAETESEVLVKLDKKSLGLKNEKKDDKQEKEATEEDEKKQQFLQDVKKQAFAGDDLQLEFTKAKQEVIDEEIDLPDLQSKQLPGWGTWAGKGTNSKKQMKKKQKKLDNIRDTLRETKKAERPDREMSHVIIRSTAAVPEQFLNTKFVAETQRKIHDNSVAHPLGAEWNSYSGFKNNIKPRIENKAGVMIKPLDFKQVQHLPFAAGRGDERKRKDLLEKEVAERAEEVEKHKLDREVQRLKKDAERDKKIEERAKREAKMIVI